MSKREASRVSMLFSAITASIGAIIETIVKIIGRSPSSPPREDFPSVAASPLRLVVYPQGGKPEEGIVQNAPPFKLCHGAAHRLEVTAPDTSTWLEQKLSLHWDANLPGDYGLSADPPLKLVNTVQPDDEKHYQLLSAATGASWVMTAKGGTAAQSGEDLDVALGSYWQAPKYGFLADVGDFHYAVTTLEWDNVIPIVDPLVTSVLTATVKSPFDDARVMAGKAVHFKLNGNSYGDPILTGEDGTAHLTYKPEFKDIDANTVTFQAYCVDELGVTSREIEKKITAFADNAWPDELKVELRDEKGEPIDPTVLGVRLTRGGKFTLFVKPDAGSFFVDQPIKLVWPEGGAQLGVELVSPPGEPEHGRPLPEAGLSWDMRGGGESGQFSLLVEIAESPMPFLLKGVQMSANLIDEVDVTVDGAALNSPLIFRRGQARTLKVQPKPGSLLPSLNWGSAMSFLSSSQLPEDKVSSVPPLKEKRAMTEQGLEWAVTGVDASGTFGLDVHMDNFTGFTLRDAVLLSQNLIDEVDVTLDGAAVSSTLILHRGKGHKLKLKPKPGSPLLKANGGCEVRFLESGLPESQVTANPAYKAQRDMVANGLEWTLTGAQVSGTFGLSFHMEGYTEFSLEEAVLLSSNLSDELWANIGGPQRKGRVLFRHGEPVPLDLVPSPGSPLEDVAITAWLTFEQIANVQEGKVTAVPRYTEKQTGKARDLSWTLTGVEVSGVFALQLHVEGFSSIIRFEREYLVSKALSDEVDVRPAFVEMKGSLYATVGVTPKPGSPLAELECRINLSMLYNAEVDLVFIPKSEVPVGAGELTWEVKRRWGKGAFNLELKISAGPSFKSILIPGETHRRVDTAPDE
ncbi:hypothetical protein [Pseudomonas entomophila]|uniref:hypothetical protein n=1 Tax=Pseudomonas entomophila TaxID=312306 RepID=UPI001F02A0B6|nr:hypothetical protein [Pseudomonas entomophila]MCG8294783.1 hypothetical protein [Pseudomonas entomophila]